MFGNIRIEKRKFHYSKYPVSISNVEIYKTIISDKIFGKNGFKYFIGYKDNKKVKLLCVMLPKMSGYTRSYDDETE